MTRNHNQTTRDKKEEKNVLLIHYTLHQYIHAFPTSLADTFWFVSLMHIFNCLSHNNTIIAAAVATAMMN